MKARTTGTYKIKASEVSQQFVGASSCALAIHLISSKKVNNYRSSYNKARKDVRKLCKDSPTLTRKILHFHVVFPELTPLMETFIESVYKEGFFDEICLFVNYVFVRKWV
jgi:hypothetical protein